MVQAQPLTDTTLWGENIDPILEIGIPLFGIGVKNWFLSKDQAIQAIDQLIEKKVPILGGDVFVREKDSFRPSYDNWYCEQSVDEPYEKFLSRSGLVAKNFISNYQSKEGLETGFALVPWRAND